MSRGTQTKVMLRGTEWTATQMDESCGGATTLTRYGIKPGQAEVVLWRDLPPNEQAIVSLALEAASEKKDESSRLAKQRFEAQEKEDRRLVAEGAAWIRDHAWHVEEDHIWRTGSILSEKNGWVVGTVKLNFCELTNDELASVMQAKEREVLNRGVGGFFRKLGRKMGD